MILDRFLVSFLVDARGGTMRSSRYSGLRIVVPANSASAPTRITCRMTRTERVTHPPQLNDGDGLACKILEMGPSLCKFNSPVLLEIPHYASLRNSERQIIVLRSDNGETWKEHSMEATEQAVQDAMKGSLNSLESNEELENRRIVRILTTDFPQYFALVTRLRQETTMIGAQGGVISSTVVPQVQAVFPENALQKRIRVGLQAQPIYPEIVLKLLGPRVSVSPIVTVEPRRRKFHKPITLTIPLPRITSQAGGGKEGAPTAANLRLLCSITGGSTPAHWEDITGSTPLSRVKDCISFTTTVSARFWLMDCQNASKSGEMADQLYLESIIVPYMGKFVLFGKHSDSEDLALRCFCITDDKIDKTLECQEGFELRAAGPEVEVLQNQNHWLEFGSGNLIPMTKPNEQLHLHFQAFQENRLSFLVRLKDPSSEPVGKLAFMRESRLILANDSISGTNLFRPLCALEVCLVGSNRHSFASTPVNGHSYCDVGEESRPQETHTNFCANPIIARSELDLVEVASLVDSDWMKLGLHLGQTKQNLLDIEKEWNCHQDCAHAVLISWTQQQPQEATGNQLALVLREIGREDVIKTCMRNILPVTIPNEVAKAEAIMHLGKTPPSDGEEEELDEEFLSPDSIYLKRRQTLPRCEDGEPMEPPDMHEVEFVRESESMNDSDNGSVQSMRVIAQENDAETNPTLEST